MTFISTQSINGEVHVVGTATNQGNCLEKLSKIFGKNEKCTSAIAPYSFGCVHQPDWFLKSDNILAFENFYYVSSAIGVSPSDKDATFPMKFPLVTTPKQYLAAASLVCGSDWNNVQNTYPKDGQEKNNNVKWCFSASYAVGFLTKGLSLDTDKPITIQKEVDGSEIEWALGAAYKEAADLLKRTNLRPE